MEKINKFQLLTLMILYEIGTTILFALGLDAKQDAWIAILLAMSIGFLLIWIYTSIQMAYPNQHLGNILLTVYGKWFGGFLVILYALYFSYFAATNFWEFGEFIVQIILLKTPIEVVLFMFIIVMLYASFLGIEVIARTCQIFFPYFLISMFLTYVSVVASGVVDMTRLSPVLENGIEPVIKAAIPDIVSFPFGESVVFLLYWSFVKEKKEIFKTAILAIAISGMMLVLSLIIIVSTLGVEVASIATVPLRRVVLNVNIANFIRNIDALFMIAYFIGGFFKMTLNFYAALLLIGTLIKVKNKKWLILPTGMVVYLFSITFFSSIVFQRWVGFTINTTIIHPFFQLPIPILLLLTIMIQKKKTNGSRI